MEDTKEANKTNTYKKLSKLPVLHRLYAYTPPVRLFDLATNPGVGTPTSAKLSHGDWIDVVNYDDIHRPLWCTGKVSTGDFYKTNCRNFTTYPYDPQRAKQQWKRFIASLKKRGKLVKIPRYDRVVRSWPEYQGKKTLYSEIYDGHSTIVETVNTTIPILERRNKKRVIAAHGWIAHSKTLGYYRVAIPFFEMNQERGWYQGIELEFVMEFAGIYEDRATDKMPILLATSAFDGARVYHYQPERCTPILEHLALRYESLDRWYWGCVDREFNARNSDLNKCNPSLHIEPFWYKQIYKRYLGCVNVFGWNKAALSMHKESANNIARCERKRSSSWSSLLSRKKGTIRWEKAHEKARQAREECMLAYGLKFAPSVIE